MRSVLLAIVLALAGCVSHTDCTDEHRLERSAARALSSTYLGAAAGVEGHIADQFVHVLRLTQAEPLEVLLPDLILDLERWPPIAWAAGTELRLVRPLTLLHVPLRVALDEVTRAARVAWAVEDGRLVIRPPPPEGAASAQPPR